MTEIKEINPLYFLIFVLVAMFFMVILINFVTGVAYNTNLEENKVRCAEHGFEATHIENYGFVCFEKQGKMVTIYKYECLSMYDCGMGKIKEMELEENDFT